jgi:hypothetical protein
MADLTPKADLDRECAAFARYLTGQTPSGYVSGKYRDAHARHTRLDTGTAWRFDRLLVSVARANGLGAWLVDAYTAVFLKRALVRRKWILLVAILETTAPTAEIFDVPDSGTRTALIARLAGRGVVFVVGLGLSAIVFLPVHLVLTATSGSEAGRRG